MCVCHTHTLIRAESKHQVNIDRYIHTCTYIEPSSRSTLAILFWKLLRKYLPYDRKVIF